MEPKAWSKITVWLTAQPPFGPKSFCGLTVQPGGKNPKVEQGLRPEAGTEGYPERDL